MPKNNILPYSPNSVLSLEPIPKQLEQGTLLGLKTPPISLILPFSLKDSLSLALELPSFFSFLGETLPPG